MDDKITALIIDELSKHHNRNDITLAVCEKGGLDWIQAEQLIEQVEEQHRRTITARQSPILVAISVVTVIGGLILVGYGALFLVDLVQQDTLGRVLLLHTGYIKIGSMLTGLAMLGGGLYGLYKSLFQLFAV